MNANSIYPDFWKKGFLDEKSFTDQRIKIIDLTVFILPLLFLPSLFLTTSSLSTYLVFPPFFPSFIVLPFFHSPTFFFFLPLLTSFLPFFLYSSLSSFLSPFPFLKSFPSMNIKEYTPLEISIILYMRGKV